MSDTRAAMFRYRLRYDTRIAMIVLLAGALVAGGWWILRRPGLADARARPAGEASAQTEQGSARLGQVAPAASIHERSSGQPSPTEVAGVYDLVGTTPAGDPYQAKLTIEHIGVKVDTQSYFFYLILLLNLTIPLIIAARLINWLLVNLLIGVREYYADHFALRYVRARDLATGLKRVQELRTLSGAPSRPSRLAPIGHRSPIPTHPSPAKRWRSMHEPAYVFTASHTIGLSVCGVIVLLYALTFTLFASLHVRQPDTLIPVALAFVLLATSLLPHLAMSQHRAAYRRAAATAIGWYLAPLLVGQILVLALMAASISMFPAGVSVTIDFTNRLLATAQIDPSLRDPALFLYRAAVQPLLFTLIATPLLLALALALDAWLKRLLLRCYAAPWSSAWRKCMFVGSTLVVAMLLQWVVIPAVSLPFFPQVLTFREVEAALLAAAAICAGGLWGGWLWLSWRMYGDRCPSARRCHVPAPYRFAARCPACGTPLTPWLVSDAARAHEL